MSIGRIMPIALGWLIPFLGLAQSNEAIFDSGRIDLPTIFESQRYALKPDGQWQATGEASVPSVIIQSSLPKGSPYRDLTGKRFGLAVFWARVVNETSTPLELMMRFPADSFPLPSSDTYLKLFLPPEKMSPDKEPLYNYGVAGLDFFLATGLDQPTSFSETIGPGEDVYFYIGMLSYQPSGLIRTRLMLKGKELFYQVMSHRYFEANPFPCGRIEIKR